MSFEWFGTATQKELDRFKAVCNQLLSRTYVVRTVYQPGVGRVNNPDYVFLSAHFEAIQEYLAFLDWDLRKDDLNGYFYVLNTDEANRCNLNKKPLSFWQSVCSMRKTLSDWDWRRTPSVLFGIFWKK